MNASSLCRLCQSPASCPLCAIMRDPRPLTSKDIGRAARYFDAAHTFTAAPRPAPAPTLAIVPDPERTAPNPSPVQAAPAPAPLPAPAPVQPARGVAFPLVLKRGDWAGLAARVEAGVTSQAEAERIGAEWMAGATARA